MVEGAGPCLQREQEADETALATDFRTTERDDAAAVAFAGFGVVMDCLLGGCGVKACDRGVGVCDEPAPDLAAGVAAAGAAPEVAGAAADVEVALTEERRSRVAVRRSCRPAADWRCSHERRFKCGSDLSSSPIPALTSLVVDRCRESLIP